MLSREPSTAHLDQNIDEKCFRNQITTQSPFNKGSLRDKLAISASYANPSNKKQQEQRLNTVKDHHIQNKPYDYPLIGRVNTGNEHSGEDDMRLRGYGVNEDDNNTRKDLSEEESCDVEALDASNSSTRSLNR